MNSQSRPLWEENQRAGLHLGKCPETWEQGRDPQRRGLVMLRGLVGGGGERDQESGARGAGNPEIAARKGLESGKEEAAWWGVGAACPMHLSQRIITLGAQNWPWESLYHRNWQVVYTRA